MFARESSGQCWEYEMKVLRSSKSLEQKKEAPSRPSTNNLSANPHVFALVLAVLPRWEINAGPMVMANRTHLCCYPLARRSELRQSVWRSNQSHRPYQPCDLSRTILTFGVPAIKLDPKVKVNRRHSLTCFVRAYTDDSIFNVENVEKLSKPRQIKLSLWDPCWRKPHSL